MLLQKILDHLFTFKFNENRFHILKAQMLRALYNHKTDQPYQHTIYYIALLLTEHAWSKADLIDAMACKYIINNLYLINCLQNKTFA